jgi:hypothetical protein
MNNADDHMRMIKATLKNTFPGINTATSRVTGPGYGFILPDGASAAPAYSFASEATLGFYRSAAGVISIAGGKLAPSGVVPVGAVHMFLAPPANFGSGGTGTGWDWLELDGSTWNASAFPALAAHLGISASTFTLLSLTDTGRFPRSRTSSLAAGTKQANATASHTHGVIGNTGGQSNDHVHTGSGTTGNDSPDHSHGVTAPNANTTTGGGAFPAGGPVVNQSTGGANTRHTHPFSFTTSGVNTDHSHSISLTSQASGSGSETRPEAASFIFAIKT